MRILRLQLLNVKLIGLYHALSDMPVVLYHGYFEFVDLISVEFKFTLQSII